jgi:hypothetical protein
MFVQEDGGGKALNIKSVGYIKERGSNEGNFTSWRKVSK